MTTDRHESRFVDDEERSLVVSVVASAVGGFVVVTLGMAVLHALLAPGHGWVSPLGAGALVGFWMASLVGGVVGNGIHAARLERRKCRHGPTDGNVC